MLDRTEAPLPTTRKHVVDRPVVRKRFEAALEGTQHHKVRNQPCTVSVSSC